MKPTLILACLALAGCVTTTTTTRTTSAKGHVVETVTVTKGTDPLAWKIAGAAAGAYLAPRAHVIDEK